MIKTVQQTPSDRATLIKFLQKHPPELIVMEATGIYYLDLAVALHELVLLILRALIILLR